MVKFPLKLYTDSAAFSLWRRGEKLDVQEYIDFVHQHRNCLAGYVNLDSIPGQPGRRGNQKQTEEAALLGWSNYRAMIKAGLDPIPVYHLGERRYWLERMIGEGATYVGLGGVATAEDSTRCRWLDECFSYLCGSKGYPQVKVHGFGITSAPVVFRYPWWSTDSVSWRMYASYGFVPVPQTSADGGFDYSRTPSMIGISKGSKATGKVHSAHLQGNHFDVMGKGTQKGVLRFLDSEGFKVEDLYTDDNARTRVALRFFKRMVEEKNRNNKPFFGRRAGLHCQSSPLGRDNPVGPFRMFFTIATSGKLSEMLNLEGLRNRLLSFEYFRRGKEPFSISHYVSTGKHVSPKKLVNV